MTERLLNAVENFYMLPTHETPRNAYVDLDNNWINTVCI